MKQIVIHHLSDLARTETWLKVSQRGLCDTCQSSCRTMPVEVKLPDLIRMGVVDEFRSRRAGQADRAAAGKKPASSPISISSTRSSRLARRANNDCIYLDATTRRCNIYEQRPNTCRNHPQIGPRPRLLRLSHAPLKHLR